MKQFIVPLIGTHFSVYVGEKEWEKWRKDILSRLDADDKMDPFEGEKKCPGPGNGRCIAACIWVYEPTLNLVLHEACHCVDQIVEHIGAKGIEFPAYIGEYVHATLLKHLKLVK